MRQIAALLALLLAALPAAAGERTPVVVELFTSQGCNSCPPADALLGELADRDDVIALSLHVDYWDYLGWQDRFATPENVRRQIAYRDRLGKRVIYTPQMVVHGAADVVGSDRRKVHRLIEAAASGPGRAGARIVETEGALVARLEPGDGTGGEIWLARFTRARTAKITRGENAGRTIRYHNVVGSLMRIGAWDGTTARAVDLPRPAAGEGVAVWVQAEGPGAILAAVKFEATAGH